MIKLIEPEAYLSGVLRDYEDLLFNVEFAGRTCYKSDSDMSVETGEKFVRMLVMNGHESVLEHVALTVTFVCSRTCSHQLVRHRLASYSQESQRYCNYNKNEELEIILPVDLSYEHEEIMKLSAKISYTGYKYLVSNGCKPEDARAVLPNCCKTEVVTTMNLRQWRHYFKIRCDKHAQEEIRTMSTKLLGEFKRSYPAFFEDLSV
jgi:thymidylate synthase (FAD)